MVSRAVWPRFHLRFTVAISFLPSHSSISLVQIKPQKLYRCFSYACENLLFRLGSPFTPPSNARGKVPSRPSFVSNGEKEIIPTKSVTTNDYPDFEVATGPSIFSPYFRFGPGFVWRIAIQTNKIIQLLWCGDPAIQHMSTDASKKSSRA
jgi:hypothetical protein